MKIEKTVCPYCGANMKILPGQVHAECEYCGSSVVISGLESGGRKERPSVDPHLSEQRYEEQTTAEPVRHAIFPPPGFRSRNILPYYVQVRTYKSDNGVRCYPGYCTTKTIANKPRKERSCRGFCYADKLFCIY